MGAIAIGKEKKEPFFQENFARFAETGEKTFILSLKKPVFSTPFFVILKFFKKILQNFEKLLAICKDIVYNIDVRNRIKRFVPAKGRYWS